MRYTRIVVLFGIVGLFVAALVLERDPPPATAPVTVGLDRMAPTVAGPEALASTWYCAAGSAAGPEGVAEQILVIANDGEAGVDADLTVHTDTGEVVRDQVRLEGHSRTQVRVNEIVTADWASVVVEAPGRGIGVDHVVTGPTGRAAGPCASSVSSSWYLPVGSTVLGVRHHLALFNPFASDAVVDVVFETETDRRNPPEYEGLVIPAGHVRVLPVDEVVNVREQIATQVVARSGLVVAEQLELVGEDSERPTATTLLLGAPAAADTWHLPAGRRLGEEVSARVVVFNPGDVDAEVDVQVLLDSPEVHGPVEPFELTVFAGQFAVVDLGEDGRVPPDVAWSAFVANRNDVPVVAAATTVAGGEADPRGQVTTLGTPVAADEWRVPYGGVGDGAPATIAVVNPTGEARRVRLDGVGAGRVEDGTSREVVVEPGRRIELTTEGIETGPGEVSWRVVADGGIVVARTTAFVDGAGFSVAPALAVSGRVVLAPAPEIDLSVDPSVALEGIIPEDDDGEPTTDDTDGGPDDPSGDDPEGGTGTDDGSGEGGTGTDDGTGDGGTGTGDGGTGTDDGTGGGAGDDGSATAGADGGAAAPPSTPVDATGGAGT